MLVIGKFEIGNWLTVRTCRSVDIEENGKGIVFRYETVIDRSRVPSVSVYGCYFGDDVSL